MDWVAEKLIPFLKDHFLALLIALCGLIFLVYGLASYYYSSQSPEDIVFTSEEADPETKPEKEQKVIVVDVSGAVKQPGVYDLKEGSRVQDAIVAAGGMTPDVDQQKVAQMLNLAAQLTDGAKLYIPIAGAQMTTSGSTSQGGSPSSQAIAGAATQLVNINAASDTELESLPGVGEVTAGKIIENRPYGAIEDLLAKEVVGEATFEKIRDLISVY
jgi:competence protein ComEA